KRKRSGGIEMKDLLSDALAGAITVTALIIIIVLIHMAGGGNAENNVGNGQAYSYTITAVIDGEVYGIPIDKESEGNRGIFLYEREIPFTVDEGDEITVIWGAEEDEFAYIGRAN